jgi:hypothetical protein
MCEFSEVSTYGSKDVVNNHGAKIGQNRLFYSTRKMNSVTASLHLSTQNQVGTTLGHAQES